MYDESRSFCYCVYYYSDSYYCESYAIHDTEGCFASYIYDGDALYNDYVDEDVYVYDASWSFCHGVVYDYSVCDRFWYAIIDAKDGDCILC